MGGEGEVLLKEGTGWGGPAALPKRAASKIISFPLAFCVSGARLVDRNVIYLWGGG